MNCPVCNRNNANNLSICLKCGAMMNDTVREELLPKISISKPLPKIDAKAISGALASGKLNQSTAAAGGDGVKVESNPIMLDRVSAALPKMPEQKTATENIAAKPTSPTLVEFHSKKSTVPEWRVQLQNVVRQRQDRENVPQENSGAPAAAVAVAARRTKTATNGANALKIEVVQERKPAARAKNPTLTSALERIENARRKFYVEEESAQTSAPVAAAPRPASKNYPFHIAGKQTETAAQKPEPKTAAQTVKPNTGAAKVLGANAAPAKTESGDLDTNKLPSLASIVNQPALQPIPAQAKISTNFVKTAPSAEAVAENKIESEALSGKDVEARVIEQHEDDDDDAAAADDCAPFSLRFNAGLFDLIIGAFMSLLLLAPFILTGGVTDWFSFTGVLAFLATCSIVMFIYLTTTVGFYGRSFGMRIFSLEVVDIEGENYPTLHQSAVSAAVYLLSLGFAGAGFLTVLFNDDRRAAHDLASGTIVVKEI